jgi:Domain of unknown function (DUF4258)
MIPNDPLGFITRCLRERKILWTYHVQMRLEGRSLSREEIFSGITTLEIIEAYPHDKYLPSYLLYGKAGDKVFHVLIAADVVGDNVRIVTAYEPDPAEWDKNLKVRRGKVQ